MPRRWGRALSVGDLRWRCPVSAFRSTGRIPPLSRIIGQDDALEALRLGLELYGPGFNTYVAGLPGVGKATLVEQLLSEMTPSCALPADRVYVNDFRHPERPSLVELPRGQGAELVRETSELVKALAEGARALAGDAAYGKRREEVLAAERADVRAAFEAFEAEARKRGFAVAAAQQSGAAAPELYWVVETAAEGREAPQLVSVDDVDEAARAGRIEPDAVEGIRSAHRALRQDLGELRRRAHLRARERRRALEALDREAADRIARAAFVDVRREFPQQSVARWADEATVAFVERFGSYVRALGESDDGDGPEPERVLRDFRANLLLETGAGGCAVVLEQNPTWANLFGQVEREVDASGAVRVDFLHVRAGSLLRADGGYLVLQAADVLGQEGVWEELKRVLRHRKLEIRLPESLAASAPVALRPEPIPINVKVVLIGDERTYHALLDSDPEFGETFKVKVSFERDMALSPEALRRYAAFVRRMEREESLRRAEPSALAALAEEAVREAGRRGRISVRFGRIADLLRESDYQAGLRGSDRVEAADVLGAKAAMQRRYGARERRVREAIREGLVLISTTGRRLAEVNGLAVYDFGDWQFGKVARITAAVGAGGAGGIVNVEREVSLSASSYDKGVHILEGYLRHTFAYVRPVSFKASLVFEQSYGGIAGDSATCAETCAILSALSGVPLRQDLAVTGSMNQHGEVQAVGDVNSKIEGFYDVCADRGLTGTQGVVLPGANVEDLMLRHDVVEACRAKRFHVYPVDRIERAIEILTGVPTGETAKPGRFRKGGLFAKVAANLRRMG